MSTEPQKSDQTSWLAVRDSYPRWMIIGAFALALAAGFLVADLDINWIKLYYNAIGPIITVVGGGVAGLVALWQYNRSHQQRDEHLDRTQKLAQDQFRSKELQDQFADIQNRLASTEPIIRANAAIRLAQFGTTLQPGIDTGSPHLEDNNPYFLPSASQLVTALYLESHVEIRKAIREGLLTLIEFAKITEGQPLLFKLIQKLADANRAAKDSFVRAMAEYAVVAAVRVDDERQNMPLHQNDNEGSSDLSFVSSVARFCADEETNKNCLTAIMSDEEFAVHQKV